MEITGFSGVDIMSAGKTMTGESTSSKLELSSGIRGWWITEKEAKKVEHLVMREVMHSEEESELGAVKPPMTSMT